MLHTALSGSCKLQPRISAHIVSFQGPPLPHLESFQCQICVQVKTPFGVKNHRVVIFQNNQTYKPCQEGADGGGGSRSYFILKFWPAYLITLELKKKMYSDSIFLNVFVFSGPNIKCILDSGEVIVSQGVTRYQKVARYTKMVDVQYLVVHNSESFCQTIPS